ncbi:ERG4/ERG24 ergosterol biosynthesis protein [Artomyces pyxidatus]|uniref:ERG4/ERG24 ergosterol biosynthesis protein n=1 Tax=Artomyces pyxidatus TaxID=48021 RepID=A0ACB8SZN8_9AGAM|nr:ERG4/ERG24 ergosterol biosynthesis protein [Artomyces pyxidatus]
MSGATAKPPASLNPRTTTYEFLGPPGAFAVTFGVPFLTYALYFGCSEISGGCPPPLSTLYPSLVQAVSDPDWWANLWDSKAFTIYYGWYAFCIVAWAILPGDWVKGSQLRNGQYQQYKINAFSTCLLAMGLTSGYILRFGIQSFTFFYDHWVGFISAALSMSVLQGLLWYALSFQKNKLLALGGNSGNPVYDFYIGRELNPTVGSLDVKSFNELRPGLILWLLIDISMACEQATRLGGRITDSMGLVLFFQILYIIDALYNEPAILTTMDITSDGFGFMLAVGDLLWVPCVYSLQARYLAFRPKDLGYTWSAAILGVNFIGYWIFRSANNEKNEFRNGRNPKNLKYMTTEKGSKLLTSGWWGASRHPNYLGDLLMALAWSLPTGFETPVTYFYVVYFAVLLIHRQRRDDEACEKKYGKDWHRYMELVPYRIVPYIY